ncbi:M1-specific T cell receptor alpha chain-like [Melanotaenia boesemani]|uniref:M1-specific T cell receptor alpha chain-like n=1 Tax=Melanotaenia boesemani TaxID=1250792 RepID=UPI001C046FD5|nr:M1-specific T cell receptor alpha chain-like [Melanotaenia boesemani]
MLRLYMLVFVLQTAYGDVIYASAGENVTLPCFYASSAKHLSWYKQLAGEQPQIISSIYKGSANVFYNNFKEGRFSIHPGEDFYHLNISDVQDSDSALYFCGHTSITVTKFNKGTFLMLKESSLRSFLQQPESESVQPGGSVSLNCTILTGTSDQEHNVYWFKRDSETSHLGTMFIQTNSSRRCVRSSESGSPAHSCVYSLSKRDVKWSDAGTYHCAVASCGQILFGRGTKLHVGEENCDTVLVQYVVAALAASLMLNIIVLFILCKKARRQNLHPEGPYELECTTDSQNEAMDAVQYVALDFKLRNKRSSRQRSSEDETVYSGVRFSPRK